MNCYGGGRHLASHTQQHHHGRDEFSSGEPVCPKPFQSRFGSPLGREALSLLHRKQNLADVTLPGGA